jgi:hypothetical protein
MATSPQQRIENLVENAIGTDYYLDTGEEREILLQSGREGVPVNDAKRIIKQTLDKFGAVNERELVEELVQLLHQYTDNDKFLDRKERADALAAVVPSRPGKRKGLDPKVANETIDEFCQANSVKQQAAGGKVTGAIIAAVAIVVVIGIGLMIYLKNRPTAVVPPVQVSGQVRGESVPKVDRLTPEQKQDIDNLLSQAQVYLRQGFYTDPPEKSVKSCLDRIPTIDPQLTYRKEDIVKLVGETVDKYIRLAEEDSAKGNVEGVRKWIGRARLFTSLSPLDNERINEVERRLLGIESR